jgi:exonuclease SbcC
VIPLKLEMTNFLSYASPHPVDFTRFDIACLTGDNGAGKTAILDAITYAIFGAARGCEDGRNQERLIREGADEMSVTFSFQLNAETYQIIRRRRHPQGNERASKGNEVRFELMTADGWTNIAKNSIRETERHIEHVLRMDYNTFVNSAFFLQGRADNFLSVMKPAERHDVFAKLLDLGSYELLENAARVRAREAEISRRERAAEVERLTAAARDPDSIQAELDEATTAAEEKRARVLDAETQLDAARTRSTDLAQKAAVLDAHRQALLELERAAAEAASAVAARSQELEEIDALLAREGEVSEALEEIERLRQADVKARDDAARAATLRARLSTLEERVRGERAAIEARIADRKQAAILLVKERKTLEPAEGELRSVLSSLTDSEGVDAELDAVVTQLELARAREAAARDVVAACTARLGEVAEKVELLTTEDAECPLCGAPLDPVHRREITRTLEATTKALTAEQSRANDEREQCSKEVRRMSEEADRLVKVQRERSRLEGSVAGLRTKCERLAAVVEEIRSLTTEHEDDEALLASEAYAAQLRPEMDALAAQIAHLYDAEAHRAVTERLAELRSVEQLYGRIAAARERRPAVTTERERAAERGEDTANLVAARRAAIDELEERVSGLDDARAAVDELERAVASLRGEAAAADTTVERLGERLEGALRTAADIGAAKAAEVDAAGLHRRYANLAVAFGPNGIPSRIVRNAVPALEEEANDILERLTDYEMRLQFIFERPTKSGGAKPTLDVLVSHDGGVRDFRMFSGGEAFRIAFAVRLGLSKLLVRRAGARLETLVIDEGFGTQDPSGRERLVEAIEVARGEFAKVLVITHLDELKDVFGSQIRVTKDPVEGSRLENCS